jgi:CRP-like cAMP-binding protein/Ca2+-binding EF-hand superfamily protein
MEAMGNLGERVRLLEQGRNFRGVAFLSKLKKTTLRKLALAMTLVEVPHGEAIVTLGDVGDAMYIIVAGTCSVMFGEGMQGAPMKEGMSFGELALITRSTRTATVTADGPVRLLRMAKRDVAKTLQDALGDDRERERRKVLLSKVPIFRKLADNQLLQLGLLMEMVVWADGEVIMTEGKLGDCMYLLEEGNPQVFVQQQGGNQGLVTTLEPGQHFGELAIVYAPASWRTASVRATGETKCLKLSQNDVHRLLTSDQCAELLANGKHVYDARQRLRASELVKEATMKLWRLMVSESNRLSQSMVGGQGNAARWQRLRRSTLGGAVTRDGYAAMHLRISRAVTSDFSYQEAKDMAEADWAEDINAFSGDSKINVWLEAVKTRLREESSAVVMKMGWQGLFDRYDTDGGGTITAEEFCAAVRADMGITVGEIPDAALQMLFEAADEDGSGELDAAEFALWVVEPPSEEDQNKYGKDINEHKLCVQAASKLAVSRLGWSHLFALYDADGGGTIQFAEFSSIIRKHCGINATILPADNLRELFNAVDVDRSAEIDADEFVAFCCSDPLASDMTFEAFAESMFQLAQLWVSVPDEVMYAKFLGALFAAITSPCEETDGSDSSDCCLRAMGDITCLAKENGCLSIEGVQTNNVLGDGKPDSQFIDSNPSDQKQTEGNIKNDKVRSNKATRKIEQAGDRNSKQTTADGFCSKDSIDTAKDGVVVPSSKSRSSDDGRSSSSSAEGMNETTGQTQQRADNITAIADTDAGAEPMSQSQSQAEPKPEPEPGSESPQLAAGRLPQLGSKSRGKHEVRRRVATITREVAVIDLFDQVRHPPPCNQDRGEEALSQQAKAKVDAGNASGRSKAAATAKRRRRRQRRRSERSKRQTEQRWQEPRRRDHDARWITPERNTNGGGTAGSPPLPPIMERSASVPLVRRRKQSPRLSADDNAAVAKSMREPALATRKLQGRTRRQASAEADALRLAGQHEEEPNFRTLLFDGEAPFKAPFKAFTKHGSP